MQQREYAQLCCCYSMIYQVLSRSLAILPDDGAWGLINNNVHVVSLWQALRAIQQPTCPANGNKIICRKHALKPS
jgi:hypothetical protein